MAPSSSARRDIVEKMVTPEDGSFDRTVWTEATMGILAIDELTIYALTDLVGKFVNSLLGPLFARQQQVTGANLDHVSVVVGLGDLTANKAIAQTPQLVAVEVVQEFTHSLGRR